MNIFDRSRNICITIRKVNIIDDWRVSGISVYRQCRRIRTGFYSGFAKEYRRDLTPRFRERARCALSGRDRGRARK